MELKVLGRFGPYPQAGDTACSGYLVTQGKTKLLVDFGPGVLARLLASTDVRDLTAIYLTHLHYDHTSDMLAFRYLLEDLGHKVKVYVHKDDSDWCKVLLTHPLLDVTDIDEDSKVVAGDFTLSFYKMNHTAPDYAVKIEGEKTLVCTGDTMYTDNILLATKCADYLLADCSKPIGFKGPHMTADKALYIQKETGVKLLSTHLSPGSDPTELFKDAPDITVVEELKTYTL